MEFETLFRQFWWLIFPIFGMFIAIWGMIANERRECELADIILKALENSNVAPLEGTASSLRG